MHWSRTLFHNQGGGRCLRERADLDILKDVVVRGVDVLDGGRFAVLHLLVEELDDVGLGLVGDHFQGQDGEGLLVLYSNLLHTCMGDCS